MNRRSDRTRQSGVTLIELLVVTGLIVVLGGIGAWSVTSWNCRQKVTNDFIVLSNSMNQLQGSSKNKNRSMLMRPALSAKGAKYVHYQSNDIGKKTDCSSFFQSKWTGTGSITEFETPFASAPVGSVCFHGDGSVNQGQSLKWEIASVCGGKTVSYRIDVHGATGFVETQKFNNSSNRWEEF